MDFPKQTLELAERVASEIRKINGNGLLSLAEGAYTFLKGRFSYGFLEGMQQGYFIRYPHEIKSEWECIEAAVYTYAVAEALGLNPRMHSIKNWNGFDTGHETVDVKVNGHRVLVDPLNHMFGKVRYTNRAITVSDNDLTERCILECNPIDDVPRGRIIQRMEYYRSDQGIINLLSAGQSSHISDIHTVFIQYNPKTKTISYQLRIHPPFTEPSYHQDSYKFGRHGVLSLAQEQGVYVSENWAELVGKEVFWRNVVIPSRAPKFETPPLKEYGKAHLMKEWLYGELLERKFGVSEGNNSERFLFENREVPMELLYGKIDKIKKQGVTPEKKGYYFDIRRAFIHFASAEQSRPEDMQHLLDFAVLNTTLNSIAREEGISVIELCERTFKKLGVDKEEFEKGRAYNAFGGVQREKVFPLEVTDSLFSRLLKNNML